MESLTNSHELQGYLHVLLKSVSNAITLLDIW